MSRVDPGVVVRRDPASGGQPLALSLALAAVPILLFAFSDAFLLVGGHLGLISGRAIGALAVLGAGWAARAAGAKPSTLAIAALLFVLASVLAHLAIDTSYDGQQYHYDATRALADGWNPLRQAYAGPVEPDARATLAPAHYPQAGWLASASLLAAGLDAETAKVPAVLLAGALFFGVLGLARRWGLTRWQAPALAALAAGNPIIIVQLLSRMNDGMLASCMGLVLVFAIVWLTESSFAAAAVMCGAMIFALNLKFSAVPLLVGVCAIVGLFAFATLGLRRGLKTGGALLAAGVAGIVVFGAHPYLSNTIRDGHPFYPVMGPGHVDFLADNRPAGFDSLSPVQRLTSSYLSRTATFGAKPVLKAPLTLSRSEIRPSGEYDTRLAGFGPFYSAALILMFAVGAAVALDSTRSRLAIRLLIFAGALAVSGLIMPEAWWARYVPQLWWPPVIVALAGMMSGRAPVRAASMVLVGVLAVNVAIVAGSSAHNVLRKTRAIDAQLAEIGSLRAPLLVALGESHSRWPLLKGTGAQMVLLPGALPAGCRTTNLVGGFGVGSYRAQYCAAPAGPQS